MMSMKFKSNFSLNATFGFYTVALLMFLIPKQARAAAPSDYYCQAIPSVAPLIFESGTKTCKDSKGEKTVTTKHVCLETVKCIYFTSALKAKVLALVNLDAEPALERFDQLRSEQIGSYFNLHHEIQGDTTVLTCEAEPSAPGKDPVCKTPEACKGDSFYAAKVASFSQSVNEKFQSDIQQNNNHMYPVTGPQKAGVAK